MSTTYSSYANGQWSSDGNPFAACNPRTKEKLTDHRRVTDAVVETVGASAANAFFTGQLMPDLHTHVKNWLKKSAVRITDAATALVKIMSLETGLDAGPLGKELERMTNQLFLWATVAGEQNWGNLINGESNTIPLVKRQRAIGPVVVFGPNNFPAAFNAIGGGDFGSAVAVGCPVISIGHPSHPETTAIFANIFAIEAEECALPTGFFQFVNAPTPPQIPILLRSGHVRGVAFTGSRTFGKNLEELCHGERIRIFAEMSSMNPAFIFPGAGDIGGIADKVGGSLLMRGGQLCTRTGAIFVPQAHLQTLLDVMVTKLNQAPDCSLLSEATLQAYHGRIRDMRALGGRCMTDMKAPDDSGYFCRPTLMMVDEETYFKKQQIFGEETFGPFSLIIPIDDYGPKHMAQIARKVHGSLATSVFLGESDGANYLQVAPYLRTGRIVFNGITAGVEVCKWMNHGGPPPSCSPYRGTSIGHDAAERWLEDITLQNEPEWL